MSLAVFGHIWCNGIRTLFSSLRHMFSILMCMVVRYLQFCDFIVWCFMTALWWTILYNTDKVDRMATGYNSLLLNRGTLQQRVGVLCTTVASRPKTCHFKTKKTRDAINSTYVSRRTCHSRDVSGCTRPQLVNRVAAHFPLECYTLVSHVSLLPCRVWCICRRSNRRTGSRFFVYLFVLFRTTMLEFMVAQSL